MLGLNSSISSIGGVMVTTIVDSDHNTDLDVGHDRDYVLFLMIAMVDEAYI